MPSLTSQPAKSLLLAYTHPEPYDRILILEGGDGLLAHDLAALVPKGKLISHDRDIRNIEKSRLNLSCLHNAAAAQGELPKSEDWDLVLLSIPKERSYARLLLLASFMNLKQGGQLLLAGPSRTGARAVIKDAQRLFGNGCVLGYRSHQRVARCLKEGELPDPLPKDFQTPGIAPTNHYSLEIESPAGPLILQTCPGIFSWEKLDQGTATLLDHLMVEPGSTVWDVGCGYGILGLTAALLGAATVLMSDINTLAVNYAQRNANLNHLSEKVKVFSAEGLNLPDSFSIVHSKFDLIVSNPAFHQGRTVDKSMADHIISRSPTLLKPGGRLLIVANRFLNYDKSLQSVFDQVVKLEENSHYHVIESRFIP